MASKPRSSDGCWTCRLRRKKCDEARPVCEGCAALEIDCLYDAAKPEWMDNGERQKEMAVLLKDKVKQRAAWRRERRFLQVIENGTAVINLTTGPDGEHIITSVPRADHQLPSTSTPSDQLDPSTSASTTHRSRQSTDGSVLNGDSGTDSSSEVVISSVSAASTAHDVAMDAMDAMDTADTLSDPCLPNPEGGASHAVVEETRQHTALPSFPKYLGPATSPAPAPSPVVGAAHQPPPEWSPLVANLAPPNLEEERDINFIMLYLDYVFPFLFPSYRPSLPSSGRGWLLMLLMKNKALFHSALSLSSFFFTVVVSHNRQSAQDESVACRMRIQDELHRQQELSLQELQKNICELNHRGVRGNLCESARVLESIVQLIYFEVIISTPDVWCLHLDAALVLFEQMMEHHGMAADGDNGGPRYAWQRVIDQISPFRSQLVLDMAPLGVPFTSEQTALRFFTTALLYIDVVSSSVFTCPPRLQQFHPYLLGLPEAEPEDGTHTPRDPSDQYLLNLETMIGIQNWVLCGVSEVSTLAAWKRAALAERRLNVVELVHRASALETKMQARVALCETRVAESGWFLKSRSGSDRLFPPQSGGFFTEFLTASEATIQEALRQHHDVEYDEAAGNAHLGSLLNLSPDGISLIWGHAILTYLLVVTNGWQPRADAIRESVSRTLALIASLPSAACLRTVTWPFCVAGCLASRAQEPVFRGMVGYICEIDVFGSVKEALHIMEAVWAQRESIESGLVEWDMGQCFSILGRTPFLL